MERTRKATDRRRGFRRLVHAARYSAAGLGAAWRTETAFRQEAVLAIVMVPTAFWLGRSVVEQLLLVATVVIVLVVELLNSAIECTLDRVGTDHHELAGRAKDMSSAAVMLSLALAALAWAVIAWARFANPAG